MDKSGQDGRKDTNISSGPRPENRETKLIVFMLGKSLQGNSEGMQDVFRFVSTIFLKCFDRVLNPYPVTVLES